MAWKIDPAHSQIEFSVKHMMITTVRGRFAKFDANIAVNPRNLLQSSIEGTIEVDSIDTRDANRDAHLRSADFFDVEKFPTMSFRSTRIEKTGGDEYKVTGDLTIKDNTRSVTFTVTDDGQGKDPWGNQRWGLSGTTTISRKDFGLTWNVALESGGWLVGDQVKIQVDMELVESAEETVTSETAAQA